jgi:hypothetical protein
MAEKRNNCAPDLSPILGDKLTDQPADDRCVRAQGRRHVIDLNYLQVVRRRTERRTA